MPVAADRELAGDSPIVPTCGWTGNPGKACLFSGFQVAFGELAGAICPL
jgi:hypothetical protein